MGGMKKIPLTKNQSALVDDEDYPALVARGRWHFDRYAKRVESAYIVGGKGKHTSAVVYMHREIMKPPVGLEVDHINGNRLDNRRSNLRLCPRNQNMWNVKHSRGSSKYKGVSFRRGRWRATICCNGKSTELGTFLSEKEAALAYNHAAIELHGDYAWLNSL